MNLLIRADAGPKIGTGHVMRMLALAQVAKALGYGVFFAVRQLPPILKERLREEGVDWIPIDSADDWRTDAAATVGIALDLQAGWVVVDGYDFDDRYLRELGKARLHTVVVDDLGTDRVQTAHVVLNPNAYADASWYPEMSGTILAGQSYALLRREFWSYTGFRRPIGTRAQSLLVTMGGADPEEMSSKVVEAVGRFGTDMRISVLAGAANRSRQFQYLNQKEETVRLLEHSDDMAPLLADTDAAVAAAGSTAWELAFFQIPAVLFETASNQVDVARYMRDHELARILPLDAAPETIREAVSEVTSAGGPRDAMLRSARGKIDVWGGFRVCARLFGLPLRLRPAAESDRARLFEWANDPETRRWSFQPESIDWDQHVRWFAQKLESRECRLYIAESRDGRAVGQIRFDAEDSGSVVSVGLAPDERGKGFGAALIALGTWRYAEERQQLPVRAEIKPDNKASIRAFTRAGYRLEKPMPDRLQYGFGMPNLDEATTRRMP